MKPFYAIVGLPTALTLVGFLFGGPLLAILGLAVGLIIGAGVVEQPENQ